MLEGGGVEDDVGLGGGEDVVDAVGVADVGEDEFVGVEQGAAVDAELGGVQAGFVAVEQVDAAGVVAVDLAGEFGADGAAGAGDQDAFAFEEFADAGFVGVDGAAAEQVLFGHVGDIAEGDGAVDDLAGAGDDPQVDAQLLGAAVQVQERGRIDSRDRDHERLGAGVLGDALQILAGAEDSEAVHVEVAFAGIVVEEANGSEVRVGRADHLLEELFAGIACSEDEGALAACGDAAAGAVGA